MSKATVSDTSDQQWKVEQDLRSLAEAAEINKDPKRLKACQALAKEKMAELAKIAK
jgi:hypothetical protein